MSNYSSTTGAHPKLIRLDEELSKREEERLEPRYVCSYTPVTSIFILIKQGRNILKENYGGEPLGRGVPWTQRNQVRAMKRFTNAYT